MSGCRLAAIWGRVILGAILVSILVNPSPAQEAFSEDQSKETGGSSGEVSLVEESAFPIHGFFSNRYRVRWTNHDADHDMYQTLALNFGDPNRNAVTGYLLGRLSEDLDGERDTNGSFVFDSIADSFDRAVNGRLYYAYADFHDLEPLEKVRLGRQVIYETPEVAYFDGALVESEEITDFELQFGAYGGLPTHLFESSPEGDYIVGAYGKIRPWDGGRFRLDWMKIKDEDFIGKGTDDLYGLGFWQSITENIRVHALHTRLGSNPRDLLFRSTFNCPEWDLNLQASYFQLITTQKDFVLEFDPFFASTKEYSPYHQVGILASKGLGESFNIQGGVDARRLKDDDDEGTFNRDWERYYLTLVAMDLFTEGMTASLTGELWDSRGRDTRTAGADITQKCTEDFKVSLGTFYSLYRYDFYTDSEKDNVRTYYVKAVNKISKNLKLDVRFNFEDDEEDKYYVSEIRLRWTF